MCAVKHILNNNAAWSMFTVKHLLNIMKVKLCLFIKIKK